MAPPRNRVPRVRRRRLHRALPVPSNLQPPKPRRPPSAFNMFVRDYFRRYAEFRASSPLRETMIYAGEFWRAHPSVKNYYGRLAHPGMERYRAQMTDYHLKKNLLKRPGHAYVRFVKSFCQNAGNGKSVGEVGKLAGSIWKRMTLTERQPFVDGAVRARQNHEQMLNDLQAGRTRYEDYLNERVRPPAPEPGREPAQINGDPPIPISHV